VIRPRAADDFATIRARIEELRRRHPAPLQHLEKHQPAQIPFPPPDEDEHARSRDDNQSPSPIDRSG
jgi:hypothetical protein